MAHASDIAIELLLRTFRCAGKRVSNISITAIMAQMRTSASVANRCRHRLTATGSGRVATAMIGSGRTTACIKHSITVECSASNRRPLLASSWPRCEMMGMWKRQLRLCPQSIVKRPVRNSQCLMDPASGPLEASLYLALAGFGLNHSHQAYAASGKALKSKFSIRSLNSPATLISSAN